MALCNLCRQSVDSVSHIAEAATLKIIQQMNPTWVSGDGACPKCQAYYQNLAEKVTLLSDQ